MTRLSGSLDSVDLPSLIKLLSKLCQTGFLELTDERWTARIGLRRGRVVAATFGSDRGLEAIKALSIVMAHAEFTYLEGPGPSEDELDLSLEQLNEHLQPLPSRPGLSFDTVLSRVVDVAADLKGERLVLERTALHKLLAVDGRRTVREVIGDEPLASGLRSLADLLELGLVKVDGEDVEHRPPRRDPTTRRNGHAPSAERERRTSSRPVRRRPQVPPPPLQRERELPVLAEEVVACPKLGFADDPLSRFPRPTGVHRCFASGTLEPISASHQRDVCLSGGYASCPRLQRAFGGEGAALPTLPPRPRRSEPLGLPAGDWRSTEDVPAAPWWPLPGPRPPVEASAGRSFRREAFTAASAVQPGSTRPVADWRSLGQPRVLTIIAVALGVLVALAWAVILLRPSDVRPGSGPDVIPTSTPSRIAPPTAAPPAVAPSAAPIAQGAASRPPGGSLETSFVTQPRDWRSNPPLVAWSDGAYHLRPRVSGRFVAVGAPLETPLADVVVSAAFRKAGGPAGGGYGLIVRDQEPSRRDGSNQSGRYYVFEVGDNGDVGAWRHDDSQWVELVPLTHSDAVQPGTTINQLSVRTVGTAFSFIVNGTEVASLTDGALGSGGVGVFARGDGNDVALEHFAALAAGS